MIHKAPRSLAKGNRRTAVTVGSAVSAATSMSELIGAAAGGAIGYLVAAHNAQKGLRLAAYTGIGALGGYVVGGTLLVYFIGGMQS